MCAKRLLYAAAAPAFRKHIHWLYIPKGKYQRQIIICLLSLPINQTKEKNFKLQSSGYLEPPNIIRLVKHKPHRGFQFGYSLRISASSRQFLSLIW